MSVNIKNTVFTTRNMMIKLKTNKTRFKNVMLITGTYHLPLKILKYITEELRKYCSILYDSLKD